MVKQVNDAQSLLRAHEAALEFVSEIVHRIPDDAWHRRSPCTEWEVRDVVNHITAENLWAEPLLDGQTVAEVGDRFDGDVLGSDPIAVWDQAAEQCSTAFGEPGALNRVVHVSFGDISAIEYLQQMTIDLVVHGWDIARGSGQYDDIPSQLVDLTTSLVEPMVSSGMTATVFADPIVVDVDADAQTRLLALTGRRR